MWINYTLKRVEFMLHKFSKLGNGISVQVEKRFCTITVTMYKTKNRNRQKMDACDSAPPSPLLGDRPLEQSLQSSHPQRSAHTGDDGSLIWKSTHIYKPVYNLVPRASITFVQRSNPRHCTKRSRPLGTRLEVLRCSSRQGLVLV